MTYHKEEYTLHNGKKIYAEYDDHNICQITKECLEMLLDLYQQGRVDAINDYYNTLNKKINTDTRLKDTIREIHDNVAKEMYCKGIDDFVRKVKERQYVLHILSDFMNCEDYGMFTVGIEEIAEELKAGGKE